MGRREGGIEKASVYYKKTLEMAKKVGDNYIPDKRRALSLSMLCSDGESSRSNGPTERTCMDPDAILAFAKILEDNHEYSRALEILEEHLEAIASSWGKPEQCRAYAMNSILYSRQNDFAKSNVYLERQLSLAKQIKDLGFQSTALNGLGHNYGWMYGRLCQRHRILGTGSGT